MLRTEAAAFLRYLDSLPDTDAQVDALLKHAEECCDAAYEEGYEEGFGQSESQEG